MPIMYAILSMLFKPAKLIGLCASSDATVQTGGAT